MQVDLALDVLLKKEKQIKARIQNLKTKQVTQLRKDETRRKILVGAYVLDKHQKNGSLASLYSDLDKFLFKPDDRALFGLEPRNKPLPSSPHQQSAQEV